MTLNEFAVGSVVGRSAELAATTQFLNRDLVGPAALVVEGEAGMGKTVLMRSTLDTARRAGLRVLSAHPTAGEVELPYAALGDLLGDVRAEALDTLSRPQLAAIDVALGRAQFGTALEQHTLSRALLELLLVEAADGRLLLAVDDAQWLDRPTTSALAFAFRRLGSVPLRVLLAIRNDDEHASMPLGLAEWSEAKRLVVAGLSATDLGAVIRDRIGAQLPRPCLQEISRLSGGNPMLAVELVRLDSTGPTALTAALRSRISALSGRTRAAVECAAAAARPSSELLLRAGVNAEDLRSAVDAGVIAVTGGRLAFTHPLLGEVAYNALLPTERRDIHARLAAASTDAIERGHHVSKYAIAPDQAAAALLDLAGNAAAGLGDHAGAGRFLLRAAELSADPAGDAATTRELRAAGELGLAGDVEAAAQLSRELVGRLGAGSARARARQVLIRCGEGSDLSYDDSLVELRLALRDAAGDELLKAELHIEAAEISLGMCRLGDALAHARLALVAADGVGDAALATHALATLGFVESVLGLGVTASARAAFAQWDGTLRWETSPRMQLACACIPATAFDEAGELFEQELLAAQQSGFEAVEVIARAHLAETQLRAGLWADALINARLALEHARQAVGEQIVTGTSYALAMTEALLGHHEAARTIATEALTAAEATRDFWFTVSHRSVLGVVALAEEAPGEAIDVLEPAWRLMLASELGDLSLFPVAHVLAEALVADHRLADASAVVEALRSSPVADLPWTRAMAGRGEALLASARGDHAAARDAILRAMHAHSQLPEPFEYARTMHIAGRIERAARNWGAARDRLTDALERFDTLGAARWAERVAADIARLPGRPRLDAHTLTARQREVAELAAAGLTNKEIAARLFISVGTVEVSLSKAYAKIGVRSRTELARRVEPR